MKPIFWVLLGILAVVVLFFGAAFITGIIEAIRGKNPEDPETEKGSKGNAEQERLIREKYKNEADLKKYRGKPLSYKLFLLGRDALKEGELEEAREYLEDSRALNDYSGIRLALVAYYAAAGEREQAVKLMKEHPADCNETDTCFAAVLLRLTDRPLETLVKGRALAKKYGNINEDLYRAVSAQLAQDVLESYDATAREARELAETGDPAGAAEFYRALFYTVKDAAEREDRSRYQEKLIELSVQTAICCCEAGMYDDAKVYVGWENGSDQHPLYRCVLMLAKTCGGTRTIKSGFDFLDLENGIPAAEKAVRDGACGAERVRKMLDSARKEALASEAVEASAYLDELAFEEAHGMSREEYNQRKKEAAEEQARAKREQKLREKIELAERDIDLLSGGSGSNMEEKFLRGDISYSDHEFYTEAKEKYIKKKSQ